MSSTKDYQLQIKTAGLRVTPQRVIALQALHEINHPTAEQIAKRIRKTHPNIATGTIYKILETFVDKKIIRKVKTSSDVMRYDAILASHHHLEDENGNRIDDYFDDELYDLVKDHLKKKEIIGFQLSEIKIQLIGKFNKNKTD